MLLHQLRAIQAIHLVTAQLASKINETVSIGDGVLIQPQKFRSECHVLLSCEFLQGVLHFRGNLLNKMCVVVLSETNDLLYLESD